MLEESEACERLLVSKGSFRFVVEEEGGGTAASGDLAVRATAAIMPNPLVQCT